ncbi:MAG: preprotein translocase subunit SecY [Kosmotogales bacterium]|nr:preprotein translocase subunit SecY [Kosmotogales bacterium]
MWKALKNAFRIPEVRSRIFFTLLAFAVFRLGTYIPVPGLDIEAWSSYFTGLSEGGAGGFIGFFDIFTGGALKNFSIFAMSVTPYINSSIMLTLLASVIPSLKEMQKEGEEGKKKYAKLTRNLTIGLAVVQAVLLTTALSGNEAVIAVPNRLLFILLSAVSMVGGTMFLLWLGEQITDRGIGQGVSMLIFAGIVARYPQYLVQISVSLTPFHWVILGIIFVAVVFGTIFVQMGERKIEIQYARRVSGRKVYGGVSSHVPIKVNQGGVIPIIFASAIMTLPQMIASALPDGGAKATVESLFSFTSPLYLLIYGALVFFFTYFYSTMVFDVKDMSNNIKNYGGYIPGIRPGYPTEQYIRKILSRVTFLGAVFLVIIALMPAFVQAGTGLSGVMLGGTSTLIAVGVSLDVLQQIESHLLVRNYEGFMKKGRLKGRR